MALLRRRFLACLKGSIPRLIILSARLGGSAKTFWEEHIMKFLKKVAMIAAMSVAANAANAESHANGCDDGEIVVKFSHVTNTDKHPKGIAATLLMERINAEMNGTMCMEVFPNSHAV